ncbi:MAG TPA: hypothetical protein VGV90_11035 [Solirubrobacteraceae bacterium]|nr:hypothetical protein [Solirubrobacteraceae bacterium]
MSVAPAVSVRGRDAPTEQGAVEVGGAATDATIAIVYMESQDDARVANFASSDATTARASWIDKLVEAVPPKSPWRMG